MRARRAWRRGAVPMIQWVKMRLVLAIRNNVQSLAFDHYVNGDPLPDDWEAMHKAAYSDSEKPA